jgi:hypothetical protein
MSQPLGKKITAACRQSMQRPYWFSKNVLEGFEKTDKPPEMAQEQGGPQTKRARDQIQVPKRLLSH